MSDGGGALTTERILEAAEDTLRRFGPSKATVVDVTRALGVSHGSVYRHFPSKAALRDAVAERWLSRVSAPLAAIAVEEGPAAERLRRWLHALIAAKRRKVLEDPELFATYHAIALDARTVVAAHVDALTAQVARNLADGVAQGAFAVPDASTAARAVLDATARFHNPVHASGWADPGMGRRSGVSGGWSCRGSRHRVNRLDLPRSGAPPPRAQWPRPRTPRSLGARRACAIVMPGLMPAPAGSCYMPVPHACGRPRV